MLSPEEEKYSYYNYNGHQGNQGKKKKTKKEKYDGRRQMLACLKSSSSLRGEPAFRNIRKDKQKTSPTPPSHRVFTPCFWLGVVEKN